MMTKIFLKEIVEYREFKSRLSLPVNTDLRAHVSLNFNPFEYDGL